MTNEDNYNNWQVEHDEDNIVWCGLDREDSNVNSLNHPVLEELQTILNVVSQDKNGKGLVIYSLKKTGFIVGADIEQFTKINSEQEAFDLIRQGQMLFDQLADLAIPTVAMIEGFCLGGGMEMALACDYRIAEDSVKTRLGLPEVMLGIHPGWGGTVRLPPLVGIPNAMDMMLTGRLLRAKAAAKMGVVTDAVPKRHLRTAVKHCIQQRPPHKQPPIWMRSLNRSFVRPWFASVLTKKVAAKAQREHYPAPYAMIDNWVNLGNCTNKSAREKAMLTEAKSVAELIVGDTAKNLVRVFFLRERMKAMAKDTHFKAEHVHVVGAGIMGGDIAAWCALRGIKVTLQDRSADAIAPAIKRASTLFKRRLKIRREAQAAMDRLTPDPHGHGVAQADVIIEAIFENLEAKQDLFKDIEQRARKDAVLATNTSSIPLDEINAVLENPERLVGIHFFNPVAKMPLVEVIHGEKSAQKFINKAARFVSQIDRLPLPVKSSPGFLVNRVLMAYLMECVALWEEGVPASVIDQAALAFGMPMGPIELADTVGLDICLSVAENLTSHLGGSVPSILKDKVAKKQLGVKSGRGFYTYKNGKAVKDTKTVSKGKRKDIKRRLIMRLINEAAACLREGIVSDADMIDAGMIFGTGFAPFRGGPMQYARTLGKERLDEHFQQLSDVYGERFKADAGWELLADT